MEGKGQLKPVLTLYADFRLNSLNRVKIEYAN